MAATALRALHARRRLTEKRIRSSVGAHSRSVASIPPHVWLAATAIIRAESPQGRARARAEREARSLDRRERTAAWGRRIANLGIAAGAGLFLAFLIQGPQVVAALLAFSEVLR